MRIEILTLFLIGIAVPLKASENERPPQTPVEWLRDYGEEVHYGEWYNQQHEAYKAIRKMGTNAIPDLVKLLELSGDSTSTSSEDIKKNWLGDNARCLLQLMHNDATLAVPDLNRLLLHPKRQVRNHVASVLAYIGPPARTCVPGLLRMLNDRPTRQNAVWALGTIQAEPATVVPALIEGLADSDREVRVTVMQALGRFGNEAKDAVPKLLSVLTSENLYERNRAAEALTRIAPAQSIEIARQLDLAKKADQARYESKFRHDPGLRCHAEPPGLPVEQGIPLQIKFEVWSIPSEVPKGVKNLNTFQIQLYLSLYLTNRASQEVFSLNIEESWGGWDTDLGQSAQPLDGHRMGPWEAKFRLVRLRDKLLPGKYDCTVQFEYSKAKPKFWGQKEDWKKSAFWSGRIYSPSFQIEILEETPKFHGLVVPGPAQLQKRADGKIVLLQKKEDFKTIRVLVRNGYYVGTRWESPNRQSSLQSGFPEWQPHDIVYDIPEGAKRVKLNLRVFETPNVPDHFWDPGTDAKNLWQMEFETNLMHITTTSTRGLNP